MWKYYIEHTHIWCKRKRGKQNPKLPIQFNLNQFNTSDYTTKELKHLWTLYNLYIHCIHILYSKPYTPPNIHKVRAESFEVCFFFNQVFFIVVILINTLSHKLYTDQLVFWLISQKLVAWAQNTSKISLIIFQ